MKFLQNLSWITPKLSMYLTNLDNEKWHFYDIVKFGIMSSRGKINRAWISGFRSIFLGLESS